MGRCGEQRCDGSSDFRSICVTVMMIKDIYGDSDGDVMSFFYNKQR